MFIFYWRNHNKTVWGPVFSFCLVWVKNKFENKPVYDSYFSHLSHKRSQTYLWGCLILWIKSLNLHNQRFGKENVLSYFISDVLFTGLSHVFFRVWEPDWSLLNPSGTDPSAVTSRACCCRFLTHPSPNSCSSRHFFLPVTVVQTPKLQNKRNRAETLTKCVINTLYNPNEGGMVHLWLKVLKHPNSK